MHTYINTVYKYLKIHRRFIFLLLFVSILTLFILWITPESIIEFIGIENGYILIFILALIGVSSFTSASFYVVLFTFIITGEFNPFLLALIAAPTMAVGDSLFFFLGFHGRSLVNKKILDKFSNWINKLPEWLAPITAYLYTAFTPLPQDMLMVALGIGKTRFWKILIAVILGNATFILWLSYLL